MDKQLSIPVFLQTKLHCSGYEKVPHPHRHLRPRRVHLVLRGDGTGVVDGVGAIDLDLTATLSAFDEPVDIQAPRDARELDLDELGGLTGG